MRSFCLPQSLPFALKCVDAIAWLCVCVCVLVTSYHHSVLARIRPHTVHKSEDVKGDLRQANGSYEGAFDETKYTAKHNTHIHTGGGKTQSNKQFEKLELDFAEKEEAFSHRPVPMEDMRTNEPDGMPYWNAHCLQGTYPPLIFLKCKVGCFAYWPNHLGPSPTWSRPSLDTPAPFAEDSLLICLFI